MTKADLIEGLSNRLGLVKIDAERVIDIVLDDIRSDCCGRDHVGARVNRVSGSCDSYSHARSRTAHTRQAPRLCARRGLAASN